MSNWSHVAGIIRIDDIRPLNPNVFDADKLIGKELLFTDSSETWDYAFEHPEEYLPLGSEGSLIKTVWINPKENDMDAYTVSIFGDLRDHHNADEVIEWFKGICDKFKHRIRNAVITIDNEYNGIKTYTYEVQDDE